MSKRSHSFDPLPETHPWSAEKENNGHTQGRSWGWKRLRPSNVEQALLGPDRRAHYPAIADAFAARIHEDEDDDELAVCFPLSVYGRKVAFGIQYQSLPSPFEYRIEPTRLHIGSQSQQ
ncbi:hypothetical protein, partial [Sporisorium scitamineum]